MRLGILSDIHANPFALRAVLKDMESHKVELILCAGDTFGYYPWAQETFDLLNPPGMKSIIGNHDQLVLSTLDGPSPLADDNNGDSRPIYYEAAVQNGRTLSLEARKWLGKMSLEYQFDIEDWRIKIVHGTPEDPPAGRYYPDNTTVFPWFPGKKEILIMGHTHYPLLKRCEDGGIILNPGSVGQPRDGDPRPGWILLDTGRLEASKGQPVLHRVAYNQLAPMELLEKQNWPSRFIRALNKTSPGALDEDL